MVQLGLNQPVGEQLVLGDVGYEHWMKIFIQIYVIEQNRKALQLLFYYMLEKITVYYRLSD